MKKKGRTTASEYYFGVCPFLQIYILFWTVAKKLWMAPPSWPGLSSPEVQRPKEPAMPEAIFMAGHSAN